MRKSTLVCISVLRMNHSKPNLTQEVLGRTNRLISFHYIFSISYDTDRIENIASNGSSIFVFVFLATRTYLQSRCLATLGGEGT
jgi:hypothetical protein